MAAMQNKHATHLVMSDFAFGEDIFRQKMLGELLDDDFGRAHLAQNVARLLVEKVEIEIIVGHAPSEVFHAGNFDL